MAAPLPVDLTSRLCRVYYAKSRGEAGFDMCPASPFFVGCARPGAAGDIIKRRFVLNILIFNCGSSSLSYKIFHGTPPHNLEVVSSGKAHRVGVHGTADAFIEHHCEGTTYQETVAIGNHRAAAELVFAFIREHRLPVDLIGHRFVHGGTIFRQTTLLDGEKLELLEQCLPLAPIHNPNSFSVIRAAQEAWPGVSQYVTFDSAFHATIPDYACTYALPQQLAAEHGFRKYGFHGLSYQDVTQKTVDFLARPVENLRLVACHLGTGGSSIAAIKGGRSLDTSMGYSPLPGLIMSTRCGDIDPSLPLMLIERGYSVEELTRIMNKQSGLLGVSGLSSDIRDLIRAMQEQDDPQARLAFEMYVHRLKQYIGAMAAVMGGLDALVFTDDVGLRCPEVREAACAGMAWCGITLDPARNRRATGETIACLSVPPAHVDVLVVPNDEERVISLEGLKLVQPVSG